MFQKGEPIIKTKENIKITPAKAVLGDYKFANEVKQEEEVKIKYEEYQEKFKQEDVKIEYKNIWKKLNRKRN